MRTFCNVPLLWDSAVDELTSPLTAPRGDYLVSGQGPLVLLPTL